MSPLEGSHRTRAVGWKFVILVSEWRRLEGSEDMLALVLAVSAYVQPAALRPLTTRRWARAASPLCYAPRPPEFDFEMAMMMAGFAFEVYKEPAESDARWERGADGVDVAFMSEAFAADNYKGRLQVTLLEADELEPARGGIEQAALTGGEPDPYVLFALEEGDGTAAAEGAVGVKRAVDVARSATCWSRQQGGGDHPSGSKGRAVWTGGESVYLYVKDLGKSQLAFTMMDEEYGLAPDLCIGAASTPLRTLFPRSLARAREASSRNARMRDAALAALTDEAEEWTGWQPLLWRPEETVGGATMAGATTGAFIAGPMGAAVGGFIGSMWKKGVKGRVQLRLRYQPIFATTNIEGVDEKAACA